MKINLGAAGLGRAALVGAVLLTACAGEQHRPLYYWGDYQDQVYHYFKTPGESPQAELAKLSETEQRAASENAALPPGFNAHLGLLYLKSGQGEKARSAFLTEAAQFPESKPYMDFLLKKPAATSTAAPSGRAQPAPPTTDKQSAAKNATPVPPKKAGDAK